MVFGGFVRDAIHGAVHGIKVPVRDVDLVLDGDIPSALRGGTRTRFAGYRVVLGQGLKVDYWALGDTLAFQRKVVETTLSNLPKSTVFTVNSCIFHLGSKRLEECNAVRDVRRGRIAFQCLAYLDFCPEYQAYRALSYAQRLRYALDEQVKEFADRVIQEAGDDFLSRVREHRPDVTAQELWDLSRQVLEYSSVPHARG